MSAIYLLITQCDYEAAGGPIATFATEEEAKAWRPAGDDPLRKDVSCYDELALWRVALSGVTVVGRARVSVEYPGWDDGDYYTYTLTWDWPASAEPCP